jgi:hypothetical protein
MIPLAGKHRDMSMGIYDLFEFVILKNDLKMCNL